MNGLSKAFQKLRATLSSSVLASLFLFVDKAERHRMAKALNVWVDHSKSAEFADAGNGIRLNLMIPPVHTRVLDGICRSMFSDKCTDYTRLLLSRALQSLAAAKLL